MVHGELGWSMADLAGIQAIAHMKKPHQQAPMGCFARPPGQGMWLKLLSNVDLVAGVGFEPTTFRL
jgi:hypothetical protein